METKLPFDDYLINSRNEYGYREISENAPKKIKEEYEKYMDEIKNCKGLIIK